MYLLRGGGKEVLLIRQLRGEGQGKINAPGGKIEPRETAEQAARREMSEETGVRCGEMEERFLLHFQGPDAGFSTCHVFVSDRFTGEARATTEAIPLWIEVKNLPLDEMWEDDKTWLPGVLAGRRGTGWFRWDEGGTAEQRLVYSL